MKTKTLLRIFLIMLCSGSLFAQRAEQPDWQYNVGGKINEIKLTEGGTLLVATNDGLVGIKPGSSDLLFNFTDYGRVKPEELYLVPGAPYVIVSQGGFANITSKRTVIDYISGKKLFSTADNGWKMAMTVDVYMPQNKLIVSGQRTSKEKYAQQVAVYDLNTGQEDYRFNLDEPGRVGVAKSFAVTGRPLLLKDYLIIPTAQGLVAKKALTGDKLWENKIKNVSWLVTDPTEKEIYAFQPVNNGSNTKIYKVGVNGQNLWPDERKVKGSVSNFEILPEGLAVVSNVDNSGKKGIAKLAGGRSESKIAFLSATTGEDLWEKAPKTKGYVQHFYIMDDGILFGIFEGGINKISFSGKTLFKKPLKTGKNILTMAQTPQGLIYITSEDANIVDLNTGDQVWKKPLKYKRKDAVSVVYDQDNSRYLISADEELFSVNENTGDVSTLAESKFEGKEKPDGIELRKEGILLTSDQNMMIIDWDGNKKWHKYFRAPGKSAMGAILAGITAVATAASSAALAYDAGYNHTNRLGQLTDRGERQMKLSRGLAAASGASVAEMLKRFKATAATENAQFILTKLDEGVGLVKINKDTGTKEKEIVLKDKKPEYQVDDFGGVLYYKAKNDVIYAYNLNK